MTKTEDEVIEFLRELDPMPDPRVGKARTFYQLAKSAPKDTAIVELGTWRGIGTIALSYGALAGNGARVHTIDAYSGMVGWAGEHYNADEYIAYQKNIAVAIHIDPILHVGNFETFAINFDSPISLLIWDGGVNEAWKDVSPWLHRIISGGIIAIRYIGDGTLGSLDVEKMLAKVGYSGKQVYQGFIYTLRRGRHAK
jgi:predicted O-methyltransferase YrrM